MLITDDGTIIRMSAKDIRMSGRATQGVRLMRLAEGAKIVSVAKAEQEQVEEADEEAMEEAIEKLTSSDENIITGAESDDTEI